MLRVVELQAKLDDVTSECRSLADSASSPVSDEIRDICDSSFSSDRVLAPKPPMPPPPLFFGYRPSPGFVPPFYSRRPPHPDRLHSPPVFDPAYVRQSPRPRDVSPPARRRPFPPEHHRSAPPYDSYDEDVRMARSPPPRGSSPYYDGGRSSHGFNDHGDRDGRYSPLAHENSHHRRYLHNRQDPGRTPSDEALSDIHFTCSRSKYHQPTTEERHRQPYASGRMLEDSVPGADHRPASVRSPASFQSPPKDDDFPTY